MSVASDDVGMLECRESHTWMCAMQAHAGRPTGVQAYGGRGGMWHEACVHGGKWHRASVLVHAWMIATHEHIMSWREG